MSCYIVNAETITVIANGLIEYGVECRGVHFDTLQTILVNERVKPIGQWLWEQNYKSYNYRYSSHEALECPEFEPVPVKNVNLGTLLGCIECYEYQACETEDYNESDVHITLQMLKRAMLHRCCEIQGFEIPWGYEGV